MSRNMTGCERRERELERKRGTGNGEKVKP